MKRLNLALRGLTLSVSPLHWNNARGLTEETMSKSQSSTYERHLHHLILSSIFLAVLHIGLDLRLPVAKLPTMLHAKAESSFFIAPLCVAKPVPCLLMTAKTLTVLTNV